MNQHAPEAAPNKRAPRARHRRVGESRGNHESCVYDVSISATLSLVISSPIIPWTRSNFVQVNA
jgi:hypothetical protein